MPTLQFAPFSSIVSPAFWHKLTDLKIDVLKLSDASLPLTGSYTAGKGIIDRETGAEVVLPTGFSLGAEAFEVAEAQRVGVSKILTGNEEEEGGGTAGRASVKVLGSFKNFNTIEEFKALDKTKYFDEEAAKIWHTIHTTRSTSDLTRFFLITFADLKKYKYYYWFAFPAFVAKPAWQIADEGWKGVREVLSVPELDTVSTHLRAHPTVPAFFLIKRTASGVEVGRVEDFETFFGLSGGEGSSSAAKDTKETEEAPSDPSQTQTQTHTPPPKSKSHTRTSSLRASISRFLHSRSGSREGSRAGSVSREGSVGRPGSRGSERGGEASKGGSRPGSSSGKKGKERVEAGEAPEPLALVAFTDPSSSPSHPGWPLRNLLAYLRALYPDATRRLKVVRWRDVDYVPSSHAGGSTEAGAAKEQGQGHKHEHVWRSQVAELWVDDSQDQAEGAKEEVELDQAGLPKKPTAVGWERNPQGKLGARLADLGPMMDPARLAAQAVDLNLKLMRWRILPQLDLEKVKETRCLLLGAGTLGCYVARGLMGWGVRTITLLDSSTVSFSNPVRQPLFEFADCLEGGKPKAECAAESLKRVYPGINATGVNLSIPMPGHPVPKGQEAKVKEDVEKLEKLFDEHDAVFLLMDSRESRWLPTVLGACKGKIVINAALGFDTFLVMRHGVRAKDVKEGTQRLGCYYCNDIVAPGDSLTDRTLDQMCTVTRPGLAPIASATAVELLTSLIQHPEGVHAPAPPPSTELAPTTSYAEQGGSVLGEVPHQIRCFLAQFRNLKLVGHGYDRCTGCAESVLAAYEKEGFDMLLKVFNDQKYLETLAGLDKLAEEGEAALEAVDWDEGDEDGDDF